MTPIPANFGLGVAFLPQERWLPDAMASSLPHSIGVPLGKGSEIGSSLALGRTGAPGERINTPVTFGDHSEALNSLRQVRHVPHNHLGNLRSYPLQHRNWLEPEARTGEFASRTPSTGLAPDLSVNIREKSLGNGFDNIAGFYYGDIRMPRGVSGLN
jgi:hypothetical protein